MTGKVDDIVLVDESEVRDAMALSTRHLSTLPEPAGAAVTAAIASGRVPGERVATTITGGDLHPATLPARTILLGLGEDSA